MTYIIEKETGLSYQDLLKKFITGPLELEDTFVYDKKNPRENEVRSYEKEIKWNESTNTHQSVPEGAGAIASTPLEVAKFLRTLLKGEILSLAMVEKMKNLMDGYGLGVMTFPYNDKTLWGHTGGIDGFRSIGGYIIEDDVTFVQLTNALDMTFNDISLAAMNSHYGNEFELPDFQAPHHVEIEILRRYEGTYSGDSFPLKLNFYIKHDRLFGRATGQKKLLLEAISDTKFEYPRADITLEFSSDGKTLQFTQGETYTLTKE